MQNIYGLTVEELKSVLGSMDVPAFRSRQLAEWLYSKNVDSFAEMTNLSKQFRQDLAKEFLIEKAGLVSRWDSKDGETTKFLLGFSDGEAVETVLMRHNYGNSVCVSTQAGCAMGCIFCASTLNGVRRSLTAGEMLAEVQFINKFLSSQTEKVDTLVLMGSGEPLMNYDNVVKFIRLLHEHYSLNMSYRNITLSTSGIVPQIYRLADEGLPITLSISLHAPDDDLRSSIMPVNKKYNIGELMKAASYYAEKTKRRVTYEYILIADVNDSKSNALELAALLNGQLANVNLIPINPVIERNLNRPDEKRIEEFKSQLEKKHIAVTVRREMGTDIQAACGQLRNKYLDS